MNRFKTKFLLPLALLCVLPLKANGDILDAVVSDSSGGLAGFVDCIGVNCFIEKSFFSVAPISIDFVVDAPTIDLLIIEERIFNFTSVAWTDFHWSLEPLEGEFLSLRFISVLADGFQPPPPAALPASEVDAFADVPIPPPVSFSAFLFIDLLAPFSPDPLVSEARFRLTQVPTVSSVPEPTTLALFGLALAGLPFMRRKTG